MVLIEDITVGMMQIIFGIMEIVSINMVQIEFIVQLGAVETNAAAGLDTLRIVIRLTRGVENSWVEELNRCGDENQHFRDNQTVWLFY